MQYPIVTFRKKKTPPPPPRPRPKDALFREELERFAAADPRWRDVLDRAAARLSEPARNTFGVMLSGLEAGPAPWPLSFDFSPDDEDGILRETAHMDVRVREALAILDPRRLNLATHEVDVIRGLVSATHRRLRIAKARSL